MRQLDHSGATPRQKRVLDKLWAAAASSRNAPAEWRDAYHAYAASVGVPDAPVDPELHYLRYFYDAVEFGPGEDEYRRSVDQDYVEETGRPLPPGYERC